MTTKKYKKLLMSEGIDRDLAEYERQTAARFRTVDSGCYVNKMMPDYKKLAARLKEDYCGSFRKKAQIMSEIFRKMIVV